jgi:hypothetical protein
LEGSGIVYQSRRIFLRLVDPGDAELFAGWSRDFFLRAIDPG